MKQIKELQDKLKAESRRARTRPQSENSKISGEKQVRPWKEERRTFPEPLTVEALLPTRIADDVGHRGLTNGNGLLLTPASEIASLALPFVSTGREWRGTWKQRLKRPTNQSEGKRPVSLYELLCANAKGLKDNRSHFLGYNDGGIFPNNQRKEELGVNTLMDKKVHWKFQTQGWK